MATVQSSPHSAHRAVLDAEGLDAPTYDDHVAELVELSDHALDAELRAIELASRRLAARRAAVVSVIEQRGSYRADGHRTITAYLRATCDGAPGTIAGQRKLARVCNHSAEIGNAVAAGEFSVDHARQIERIAANPRIRHVFADVAPTFCELAKQSSYADFASTVDQFITLADVDGAFADLAAAVGGRDASVDDLVGAVSVTASGGDPLTAQRLALIFRSFCEAEYRADTAQRAELHGPDADDQPLPRSAAQRRFDALVSIFDTAAAADAPGMPNPPTVNVVIDADTFDDTLTRRGYLLDDAQQNDHQQANDASGDNVPGNDDAYVAPGFGSPSHFAALIADFTADPGSLPRRRCHTSSANAVHPAIALRAALVGHVRRVVVDSASVVIDLGTRQRLFTGNARTAANLLVPRCTHPGCAVPVDQCDIDHMIEYHQGGATQPANADVRCNTHNRFKHHERLRTVRHAPASTSNFEPEASGHRRLGRVSTYRRDGSPMAPVGAPQHDQARGARANAANVANVANAADEVS